jgi:hypothetical protein
MLMMICLIINLKFQRTIATLESLEKKLYTKLKKKSKRKITMVAVKKEQKEEEALSSAVQSNYHSAKS